MERNYTPIQVKKRLLTVILVFMPGLLLLIALAHWQWQRGNEKARALAQMAVRANADAIVLSDARHQKWPNFQNVKVHGRFLANGPNIVLDNRVRQGVYGYHTLSVFVTDDGSYCLVDQGWLPMPATENQLTPPERDATTLVGLIYRPDSYRVTDFPPLGTGQVWRIPGLNLETIQREIAPEQPWMPFVLIQLLPESRLGRIPEIPILSTMPPERHYGYAVQWSLLALTWCLLWGYLWRKSKRELKNR
ncbi:MAG: SURF1 family protein [Gammaproteobacteria bacterium]|nr:MAG: SURF1 family protein [Gammaproteobacteria bacterium]